MIPKAAEEPFKKWPREESLGSEGSSLFDGMRGLIVG